MAINQGSTVIPLKAKPFQGCFLCILNLEIVFELEEDCPLGLVSTLCVRSTIEPVKACTTHLLF